MDAVSLADLKDQIDALIGRVEAGESIDVARDGQTVARIVPVKALPERSPIDVDALRRLAASLPFDPSDAGGIVRRMRDDARY